MFLRYVFVLTACASVAVAQTVAGRVLGFAGEPVAGVVLNLLDGKQEYVADVATRASGVYRLRTEGGTQVRAWLEGVVLTQPLPAAGAALDFDFSQAKYFTLRGNLVDPEGAPLPGVEVFCSDAADGCLASVKTTAAGAFAVRCNQRVDHLTVDRGWQHRVAGPFDADRGIAIDLRLEKTFFLLQGTLLDENKKPADGVRFTATVGSNGIASTHTDRAGHWRMWCNQPVKALWFQADAPRISHVVRGEWGKAGTVDLDYRGCGFVVLTGRVVDAAGKAVAGKSIVPLRSHDTNYHLPEAIGTTDVAGRFRVLVPSWANCVHTWIDSRDLFADGPWTTDAEVELRDTK